MGKRIESLNEGERDDKVQGIGGIERCVGEFNIA